MTDLSEDPFDISNFCNIGPIDTEEPEEKPEEEPLLEYEGIIDILPGPHTVKEKRLLEHYNKDDPWTFKKLPIEEINNLLERVELQLSDPDITPTKSIVLSHEKDFLLEWKVGIQETIQNEQDHIYLSKRDYKKTLLKNKRLEENGEYNETIYMNLWSENPDPALERYYIHSHYHRFNDYCFDVTMKEEFIKVIEQLLTFTSDISEIEKHMKSLHTDLYYDIVLCSTSSITSPISPVVIDKFQSGNYPALTFRFQYFLLLSSKFDIINGKLVSITN